jgi:hypothetical protein
MTAPAEPVEATDPRVRRRPRNSLGRFLNQVDVPVFDCPACSQGGPLEVFVLAVRWPCGHTRDLPFGNVRSW